MITGGIQLHHGIPLRQTIIQYQGKAEAMRVVLKSLFTALFNALKELSDRA